MRTPVPSTVADLTEAVLRGAHGPDPAALHAVGAFWVRQSTQFPGTDTKYRNYYLVLRAESAFGGCCLERDQLDSAIAEELSGRTAPAHLIRLIAEEQGGGLQYALNDGALVMGAVLPDA